MPLTTPDDIVDASDEDELVFTYIVCRIKFNPFANKLTVP